MSKQTAVQWLFEKLWDTPKDKLDWQSIFLMAHQMHEDEIRDAHFSGSGYNNFNAVHNTPHKVNESYNKASQYYKETYGGQDE